MDVEIIYQFISLGRSPCMREHSSDSIYEDECLTFVMKDDCKS